jgi:hypothetical protein
MNYFLLHNFHYSLSLNVSIQVINYLFCALVMPNLDPWMNQQNSNRNDGNEEQQQEKEEFTTSNKFKQQLLSIKDERQKMIYPNCHPTYNERHEKIIELIDWTLERYRGRIKRLNRRNK